MIQRYSRPEMRAIWTDENKLQIWLQIELLASEALVKEGVVPAKDFAKIEAGAKHWFGAPKEFVERAREIEKLRNHDVIAFTEAVAEKIMYAMNAARHVFGEILSHAATSPTKNLPTTNVRTVTIQAKAMTRASNL